jgi:hypothetical protein
LALSQTLSLFLSLYPKARRHGVLSAFLQKKSRPKARFQFHFLSLPNNEPIQCLLSLEMFCRLMSFGHSASQA